MDDSGNRQDVLWWGGALKPLPKVLERPGSRFDLAYTVRARTYCDEGRISLEYVDYRIVEEGPAKVSGHLLEILDMRLDPGGYGSLPQCPVLWAEDPDKHKGFDRVNLQEADKFAIWTVPPSPADLRTAVGIVKPNTIYLFAIAPASEGADEFLRKLSGMAKFIINERGGLARFAELEAATAERTMTIRLGLEWMAASGHVRSKATMTK